MLPYVRRCVITCEIAAFGMFNRDMYQKLSNRAQPLTESMIDETKLKLGYKIMCVFVFLI